MRWSVWIRNANHKSKQMADSANIVWLGRETKTALSDGHPRETAGRKTKQDTQTLLGRG